MMSYLTVIVSILIFGAVQGQTPTVLRGVTANEQIGRIAQQLAVQAYEKGVEREKDLATQIEWACEAAHNYTFTQELRQGNEWTYKEEAAFQASTAAYAIVFKVLPEEEQNAFKEATSATLTWCRTSRQNFQKCVDIALYVVGHAAKAAGRNLTTQALLAGAASAEIMRLSAKSPEMRMQYAGRGGFHYVQEQRGGNKRAARESAKATYAALNTLNTQESKGAVEIASKIASQYAEEAKMSNQEIIATLAAGAGFAAKAAGLSIEDQSQDAGQSAGEVVQIYDGSCLARVSMSASVAYHYCKDRAMGMRISSEQAARAAATASLLEWSVEGGVVSTDASEAAAWVTALDAMAANMSEHEQAQAAAHAAGEAQLFAGRTFSDKVIVAASTAFNYTEKSGYSRPEAAEQAAIAAYIFAYAASREDRDEAFSAAAFAAAHWATEADIQFDNSHDMFRGAMLIGAEAAGKRLPDFIGTTEEPPHAISSETVDPEAADVQLVAVVTTSAAVRWHCILALSSAFFSLLRVSL
eukprot:TRINITY_DN21300_c0_g4_i1.p1 TRINITY_DN21300_c0_g4~~TRINITY_DN21300_c0_g4_i1.p1  ORF type:complete len:526 (-),score=129.94 TRINITY_DN21300_c0_g4_i1:46-1623(-)